MKLTKSETDALEALCDTFVPSLAFEPDEDPALFSMSARDMGVAQKVAEALDRIDSGKRSAFRLFLAMLENPVFIVSVSAKAMPFSRLPLPARERVLLRLAKSALPQLRTAYQGARSLVMLHTYAADGTPESDALLRSIGYDANLNPKATAPRIPVARVSDVAARISSFSRRATFIPSGSFHAFSVTSRYASSSDIGSTSGVIERKIAKTCCETVRYLLKSGWTMTSEGQSRTARDIGIADRTPNVRAS